MSWFNKLRDGLKKTSTNLAEVFTKSKLDTATLEELEELLILSDMGAGVAASITAEIATSRHDKDITGEALRALLAAAIARRLEAYAAPLVIPAEQSERRDLGSALHPAQIPVSPSANRD